MSLKRNIFESIIYRLNTPPGSYRSGSTTVMLSLLTTSMIFAAGCAASADNEIPISLEKTFQLRVGESALVSAEKLALGFQSVTSDSRCGKGDVCIWEGDAIVRIWLQIVGGAKQERELHTGSREPNAADYAGYEVLLVSLSPAPISGRSIAPEQYIATLKVTRGISGNRNIY